MKLVHVIGDVPVFAANRAIAALPHARHAVARLTRTEGEIAGTWDAVTMPPFGGLPAPSRYRAIAEALRRHDGVLTYGYGAIDALIAGRIFARELPPIIHHELVRDGPQSGRERVERRLFRRFALPAATQLVVARPDLRAVATSEWGRPEDRVEFLPPGAVPSTSSSANPFGRKRGEFLIGASGAGGGTTLEPVLDAVDAVPNARLILFDADPALAHPRLSALRAARRLVTPAAPRTGGHELHGVDLWLAGPGGTPTAIVEAMAAGLPVIGLPEDDRWMLSEANEKEAAEQSGDLVAAVLRMAGYGDLRRAVGKANRERFAQSFDEERLTEQAANIYAVALHARR